MIPAVELEVQRRITGWFIDADTVSIVLTRNVKSPNGSGGYTNSKVPQPAQSLRMNPLGDGATERTTADGKAVTPSYMLIGRHTDSIVRGDEFVIDGRRYQVVFVNENRQYEVKGEVAYLG